MFSPFLFWTIVIISGRCNSPFITLRDSLIAPYRQLLGNVLAGPIRDLESIQGLIFLCLWPLPVGSQTEDPSWNYCGLLTNAAIRMGLHTTGAAEDGTQSSTPIAELRLRSKTWMACLKVNAM